MARIFEVNKKLVEKMKAIKHLLTEEDKKLMDETDPKRLLSATLVFAIPFSVLYNPRTCAILSIKAFKTYLRLLKSRGVSCS